MKKWKYIFGIALLLVPNASFGAVNADLGVSGNDVYLSNPKPVDSTSVRIYATINNSGSEDALGSVRFFDITLQKQIGTDQPISLIPTRADDVFVDWLPEFGTHEISVEIIPWTQATDDPNNNFVTITVTVDRDTDKDGVGNQSDIDDDNDGVADTNDVFPLNSAESADTDGDGIGNNADTDDDNDDVLDIEDAFPFNPTETGDFDKDGIGDNADTDDDNDGIADIDEDTNQNNIVDNTETDQKNPDSDADGVIDGTDAFPLDPLESADFDGDNIGDNADTDDDDDEVPDVDDVNPNNQGPQISIEDVRRSVDVNNTLTIDTSESVDLDGEIVNTVIVIEKISEGGVAGATTATSGSQILNGSQNTNEGNSNIDGSNSDNSNSNGNNFVDKDEDGIMDGNDNCPTVPNSDQADANNNGLGNACDGENQTNRIIGKTWEVNDQGAIILSSIDELIAQYFGDTANITSLDEDGSDLFFDSEDGSMKLYSYLGERFQANFTEPGTYKITVIAQDDKGETRSKEILVKVRDYGKIFRLLLIIGLVLLAILMALKYTRRANFKK